MPTMINEAKMSLVVAERHASASWLQVDPSDSQSDAYSRVQVTIEVALRAGG